MNPSFRINSARYPVLPPGAAQASSTFRRALGRAKGKRPRCSDPGCNNVRRPRFVRECCQAHEILVPANRFGIGRAPREETRPRNLDSIDAGIDRRRPIIPLAKRLRIFLPEVFRPTIDQELRMRISDAEILLRSLSRARSAFPRAALRSTPLTRDRLLAAGQLDRFEDRRVFRSFEQEELVKAEPQQIARIVVEMSGAQRIDPEIEQRQVSQDAVEKFRGEGAIRADEIARPQELPENRVGKLFAAPPFRRATSQAAEVMVDRALRRSMQKGGGAGQETIARRSARST